MAEPQSEVFLLVRFPPSSQRSPNDLQIQLLHQRVKQAEQQQPGSARSSAEFSRSDVSLSASFSAVADTSVDKSGHERSSTDASGLSTMTRTPSIRSNRSGVSSVGSTASAPSRRTTPLYNLSFHKLLSTTITDAGTDARVAKFLKKGIQIEGLCYIEAFELLSTTNTDKRISKLLPQTDDSAPPTPTSPSSSVASPAPSPGPTSLLTKFKRFSMRTTKAIPVPSISLGPKGVIAPGPSTEPAGPQALSLFKSRDETAAEAQVPTTTGEEPTIPYAKGYSWTVKKWMRKDLEGKEEMIGDIAFEWRRSKRKNLGGKRRRRDSFALSRTSTHVSASASSSSVYLAVPDASEPSPPINSVETTPKSRPVKRNSIGPSSVSSSPPLQADHDMERLQASDEEPDSDPEDSERPFICDLVFNPKEGKRRVVHLGVLTPSVHHPKLVANLQVPSSLAPTSLISGEDAQEVLTAEEMKDVLAVSALWLVIREKIGGTGRRR